MSLKNGIEKLSKTMDELGLAEITVEHSFLFGIWKKEIHLSKTGKNIPTQTIVSAPIMTPATQEQKQPEVQPLANAIKSPMVGVAYLAPEPGAKPFITVGSSVNIGDTICLIEAMKTFNPIKSDKAGTVRQILIKDAEIVEFDTPLVVIE